MDHKEFCLSEEFRSRVQVVSRVSLGCAGFLAVHFLLLHWLDEGWRAGLLSFYGLLIGACGITGLWGFSFRRRPDKYAVAVDAEGMHSLDPRRPQHRFLWSEIATVKLHPFLHRIQLKSATRRSTFPLSCGLAGIQELIQVLLAKTQYFQTPTSLPVTFQRKIPRKVFIGFGIYLGFALLSELLTSGRSFITVFFPVGMLMLFGLSWTYLFADRHFTHRLVVTDTGFQLYRGLRIATTPFSAVTAINFIPTAGDSHTIHPFDVSVTLANDETMTPCPFGCNPFAVYRALKTAWQQA